MRKNEKCKLCLLNILIILINFQCFLALAEIEEKLNAATVNYDKLLKDAEDMQKELARLDKKGGRDFAIFSYLLFASKMSEFE